MDSHNSERRCVRPGCHGLALTHWWRLCTRCTTPQMLRAHHSYDRHGRVPERDVRAWAKRIAPGASGRALPDDLWVLSIRCLVWASVFTYRSKECPHVTQNRSQLPVVALPQAPGLLQCPRCARTAIDHYTTTGPPCYRCPTVVDTHSRRCAIVTGSSLIIVAHLCSACASISRVRPALW